MNNKRKIIILSSIILGVLVAVLGLTYAAFTYDRTGNNSDLVLGDIYMHYKENNQLMFNDAMPTSIDKYTTYKVNPVMATQEIVDNELTKCISIYTDFGYVFDEESDAEAFCKGTGTANGMTIQEDLDDWIAWAQSESTIEEGFLNVGGQELLDVGIILQGGDTYKVNPVMATQEVVDNELTRCISIYTDSGYEFDAGSTAESFCKGTGTRDGMTIQEDLDAFIEFGKEVGFDFLKFGGQELLDAGVIIRKIENLPYFEFTISGKNTYLDEDIWFEIVLNHGDDHETRTTRIRDELLRFTLVETENDEIKTILLNNKKYGDLSNKRIWVETIKANTTSEINKTYRLYAWISDETVIGNVNEDYTTEEWNDVFASIKVNVTGDFEEKQLAELVDASCFETSLSTEYIVNSNMTEEELNACVTIHRDEFGLLDEYIDNGNTLENYCRGTATVANLNFQGRLLEGHYYNQEELDLLVQNNIIFSEESINITNYDESCGSDIIIPNTINGYNVRMITNEAFNNKGLYNVILPNTIIAITDGAFTNNYISSVEIPDSVKYLFCYAFDESVNIKKNSDLRCLIIQ